MCSTSIGGGNKRGNRELDTLGLPLFHRPFRARQLITSLAVKHPISPSAVNFLKTNIEISFAFCRLFLAFRYADSMSERLRDLNVTVRRFLSPLPSLEVFCEEESTDKFNDEKNLQRTP